MHSLHCNFPHRFTSIPNIAIPSSRNPNIQIQFLFWWIHRIRLSSWRKWTHSLQLHDRRWKVDNQEWLEPGTLDRWKWWNLQLQQLKKWIRYCRNIDDECLRFLPPALKCLDVQYCPLISTNSAQSLPKTINRIQWQIPSIHFEYPSCPTLFTSNPNRINMLTTSDLFTATFGSNTSSILKR